MASRYLAERERYHKYLIPSSGRSGKREEIRTTPLFSLKVKHTLDKIGCNELPHEWPSCNASSYEDGPESDIFPQYGLIGHNIGDHTGIGEEEPILLNVDAPNSAFICGSQGSGKSFTLSSMLENCLLGQNDVGNVQAPVAGVVFHYNVNSTTTVAEAAHLCTRGIKVNVFVSRSNERALTRAYKAIDSSDNLTVRPLLLRSSDLSVDRMNKLMAMSDKEGPIPLYMEVVQRILRGMATDESFDYANFKAQLGLQTSFTKDQTGPMNLRLSLLESFMEPSDIPGFLPVCNAAKSCKPKENLFSLEKGTLTIIDLSDAFVDASTACMLFDICLGLIKEQRPPSGLAIALDEAHKFMNKSSGAANFTDRLLTTIREQRHNATRVYIATQEPTISERLLDLCSMTIVHRFTSPAWFASIRDHLSGASNRVATANEQNQMFERIVDLNVGESLVFAPSAYVVMAGEEAKKLGAVAMKMKTRIRLGTDGGMSVLASGMAG